MRLLILLSINQLLVFAASADSLPVRPEPIDQTTLESRRLFFTAEQRKAVMLKQSVSQSEDKKSIVVKPVREKNLLHYSGIVRSDRGVQLLLNGMPWRAGLMGVVSARLSRDSELIEIKTEHGKTHQLMPGESVELKQ